MKILYGSILGDIAGSRFEFTKPQGFQAKTVKLFEDDCFFTDDTVMSIATKYAVCKPTDYAKAYGTFGRKYPGAGYGTLFQQWLKTRSSRPYNSFGNGSAMRVAYIGEHFRTLERVQEEAQKSAMCTHNHPEGVKGAVAIAGSVFLAKNGASKTEIKKYVESFGYSLRKHLFLLRKFSKFDITCQGTVPVAMTCFLESDSWEECIRNVLSITCDSDTVACIAGGVAEAYFGTTGYNEKQLLEKYLIRKSDIGTADTFLYDWATLET